MLAEKFSQITSQAFILNTTPKVLLCFAHPYKTYPKNF